MPLSRTLWTHPDQTTEFETFACKKLSHPYSTKKKLLYKLSLYPLILISLRRIVKYNLCCSSSSLCLNHTISYVTNVLVMHLL